jgi:hydroxyacylglutathione hydrolase
MTRIVPLSALRDNYIWAVIEGQHCVVIDPGEAAPVLHFLKEHGLSLSAILLTHRHADHQDGVAGLLAHASVPVWGPSSTAMPRVTHPVSDHGEYRIDGFSASIQVLSVPGHTEEHIAYRWGNALFCGDTLFAAGCGRLLGGTAEQLYASLQKLASLPANTLVCCAHEYTLSNLAFAEAVEPNNLQTKARRTSCNALRQEGRPTLPSSLSEELATNPFLRCSEADVRQAAEIQAGHALHEPLAVFTVLRKWKDGF